MTYLSEILRMKSFTISNSRPFCTFFSSKCTTNNVDNGQFTTNAEKL